MAPGHVVKVVTGWTIDDRETRAMRQRQIRFGALLALLFIATTVPATAQQKRIALVIGNSGYGSDIGKLANPKNDATLMASTLRSVGFDVLTKIDGDRRTMARAIQEFGRKLTAAGKETVGLFYYAGHGVQANGTNYLIPVGAAIGTEADLEIEAVSAAWVLGQMEYARNALNVVVLDACRNNPFKRSFRSATRGLARMDAPRGSILAYAAGPGQVAADGASLNSPYTEALTRAMRVPGLKLEDVFKRVRVRVELVTQEKQTPWEESSLRGDFYFVAPNVAKSTGTAMSTQMDKEALFWNTIKGSRRALDFQAYLDKFPNGTFASLARDRFQMLRAAASPDEIRRAIIGKTLTITLSSSGFTSHRIYRNDGTVSIKSKHEDGRRISDTGKWQIRGGRLCHWWQKIGRGKRRCPRVILLGSNFYFSGNRGWSEGVIRPGNPENLD